MSCRSKLFCTVLPLASSLPYCIPSGKIYASHIHHTFAFTSKLTFAFTSSFQFTISRSLWQDISFSLSLSHPSLLSLSHPCSHSLFHSCLQTLSTIPFHTHIHFYFQIIFTFTFTSLILTFFNLYFQHPSYQFRSNCFLGPILLLVYISLSCWCSGNLCHEL